MLNFLNKIIKPKKYKCPYCLNSYPKADFEFSNVDNFIQEVKCPNKDKDQKPNGRGLICNKKLPYNFFEGDSKTISFVGGSNVGKTYYSIILLKLLQECHSLHKFGISGNLICSPEQKREIDNYVNDLFENNRFNATLKDTISINKLDYFFADFLTGLTSTTSVNSCSNSSSAEDWRALFARAATRAVSDVTLTATWRLPLTRSSFNF